MKYLALFCVFVVSIASPQSESKYIYNHSIKNNYCDDISFCIADLKFDGQQVYICEFGEGLESRFKGYDSLYGDGAMWRKIWRTIAAFSLPLSYVGTEFSQSKTKNLASHILKQHCTEMFASLNDLQAFYATQSAPTASGKKLLIAHSIKLSTGPIHRLQKTWPEMMLLGNATSHHVRSKKATNMLFDTPFLKQFKPATLEIEKKYTGSLAYEIIQKIPSDFFVIKPPSCALGLGVILVSKQELDDTLRLIIAGGKTLKDKRFSKAYSYWAHDRSATIMVEAFIPSKTIIVNELPFDGTMRVVFVVSNLNGQMGLQYLGAYWKLPAKNLGESACFMDLHKSSISSSRISSERVDAGDYDLVCQQLSLLLPPLYEKMLAQLAPK